MHQCSPQKTDLLAQLSSAERLFIWGFRSVFQCQRLGWPTVAEIRDVYDHFHVSDAVPSLEALLEAFACTAHTAIELHCPICHRVSASEHGLLNAISATQRERIDLAREQFERWLPPLAADWALAPACGLTTIFQNAGLTFPLREISSFQDDGTMAMQSWPVGTPTLH